MPTARRTSFASSETTAPDRTGNVATLTGPLAAITCLAPLPQTTLDGITQTCRHMSYAPGDVVGGPGAGEASMAFVRSGAVRISMPPDRHGDVAFQDVGAGGVFGHLEALAGETPHLSAVSLSESKVSFLSADEFCVLVTANPAIALQLLRAQALDAMNATPRAPHQADGNSHKLYAELLRMAETDPDNQGVLMVSRLPRHRELADWTGLSEADVAAGLASLVKSGCAERRYPGLSILDADKLRQMATA